MNQSMEILLAAAAFAPAPVFGVAGLMGSGKDTVAKFIAEEYDAKIIHFADPIYESAKRLNPYVLYDTSPIRLMDLIDKIGWDKAKRTSFEVRRLLQIIGTECGRNIHGEDCWIELAADKIRRLFDRNSNEFADPACVLIPDVRFHNEAAFIKSIGMEVLYVERPGLADDTPEMQHISEQHGQELKLLCKIIKNDGTLDNLKAKVLRAMEKHLKTVPK